MKVFGDYHMHTRASDGRGTVLDKARRAAELGLEEIAIADHGTGSFLCHQTERKFRAQQREIARANDECGVRVLSGIEASITGESGLIDVPASIVEKCDVLTVGFHRFLQPRYVAAAPKFLLVNGWGSGKARAEKELIELNTRAWLAAMERYPVDVLCHIGHRAAVDVGVIARAAAEKGIYIELNEKHIDALEGSARIRGGVHLGLGRAFHCGCRGLPLRPRIFETARHRGREGVRHRQKAGVPPEKGVHPHEMTE